MNQQGSTVIAALKAARAALDWSQDDLARKSGTALVTIARLESGRVSTKLSTIAGIKQTLETAGVRIIDEIPPGGFTLKVEAKALKLFDQERRAGIGPPKAAKKRIRSEKQLHPPGQESEESRVVTARPKKPRRRIG